MVAPLPDGAARESARETRMAVLRAEMTDKIKDAKHWRERAAEIRARAIEMEDGVSRRVMLSIAESYVLLAQQAEEISGRSE
jgi:hypothetical protein